MKQYTCTEIKNLHEFSVGGNIYENTCHLSLFNEDENGVETDTVVIELTQTRLRGLIKSLEYYAEENDASMYFDSCKKCQQDILDYILSRQAERESKGE